MRCKSMVLSGVLFILMIFLTACSESNIKLEDTGPTQTIVKFEDPGLEKALREALNKPSGDIYVNDLKKVKTLIAEFHKIQSLKGIEYCTSLETLSLSYNQINDLRPLAGLTSLRVLALGNNEINDISPLAGLTALIELYLVDNQISDLSPLAGLTCLELLFLNNNRITDVSPLSGLTSLVDLFLNDNPLNENAKTTIIPLLKKNGANVFY